MFIRNRQSLKAVGVALCFSYFGLSVSSAAGPSLLTSLDEARESSIAATQQGAKLAQDVPWQEATHRARAFCCEAKPVPRSCWMAGSLLSLRAGGGPGTRMWSGDSTRAEQPTINLAIVIALAAAVVVLIAK